MDHKYCSINRKKVLTNLSEGGNKDPEGDDEGDLHPLELDVEDMVLRGVSVTVAVTRAIMTKLMALDRVLIKHFLMTTKSIICCLCHANYTREENLEFSLSCLGFSVIKVFDQMNECDGNVVTNKKSISGVGTKVRRT